jgi:hypothetical protein
MVPLKLTLPVPHDYTDPTVAIEVGCLRAWLDDRRSWTWSRRYTWYVLRWRG